MLFVVCRLKFTEALTRHGRIGNLKTTEPNTIGAGQLILFTVWIAARSLVIQTISVSSSFNPLASDNEAAHSQTMELAQSCCEYAPKLFSKL